MKNEQEIRDILAEKLMFYRKRAGLTQSELAEKINYSDKSVSKWERAEGMPDIYVLNLIAEICSVDVAVLLSHDPLDRNEKKPHSWNQRLLITMLAVGIVWLSATVIHFVLGVVGVELQYGIVYYCAIPLSAIVLTVFTVMWFKRIFSALSVTTLIWSIAFGIWLYIKTDGITLIFAVATALQVLVILWYILLRIRSGDGKKN